jgi:hypothetical protein
VRGRPFQADTDEAAIARIWREIGWIEADNEAHAEAFEVFVSQYRGLVSDLDGSPECYVATGPGSLRYQTTDVPLSAVAAVTTSQIARRRGLAGELTAAAVARDAEQGAAVSALGIFDQGFYDRLGFGTGGYEVWRSFDPATLRVPVEARIPIRLGTDDWERMHASRLTRMRGHGAVNIDVPAATRSEMLWAENGFGFGYADGPNGELTHHFWASVKDVENGPWYVWLMAYQTPEQFLELMALMQSVGDQLLLIRMREPGWMPLQDLLDTPFRRRRISQKSQFEAVANADAYWQMRICDVPACLGAVRPSGSPIRFNLAVTDPIDELIPADIEWRGVAGDYVVELGSTSSAVPGADPSLPTLQASVGALTRLWLGVLPASSIAATGGLSAPSDLLANLDEVFLLPSPRPDWDF